MGFLAGPRHVLTAAHVVAAATGAADADVAPSGPVTVDLPLVAPGRRFQAAVACWVPVAADGTGDVAGLVLRDTEPPDASAVPLDTRADLFDHKVTMFGLASGRPDDGGGWSVGRLRERQATGLVQIDLDPDSQFPIRRGFSGAAVWDTEVGAVVGMVVGVHGSGRIDVGYMVPARALLDAWPELADLHDRDSPFRPLRPFSEQDAALFYGRGELVERIVQLTGSAPVITVLGPSGVGKSSLVHAGVLPRVRSRPGLVVAVLRPSDARTPLHALALALDRVVDPTRDPIDRMEAARRFADEMADGAVAELVGAVLDDRGAHRLLVVVDQFEEVFRHDADEVARFARVLRHAAQPGSRLGVLCTVRTDFLGAAQQHREVAPLVQDRWIVTVAEMTREELREAITGPLEQVPSVHYEPGLVDRLLDDVGHAPGRLPLLQFALGALWERRQHHMLTHRAYEESGRVDGALTQYAEQVWSGLDTHQRTAAARLLTQLLWPTPDGTALVRRAATRDELDDEQWAIAQHLATARLVVLRDLEPPRGTDRSARRLGVELAHETLVTHWARLARLAERDREFRIWQEGLRQRIARWERSGSRRRLLSGADLRDARRWARSRAADLTARERRYIGLGVRRQWWYRAVAAITALAVTVTGLSVWRSRDQRLNEIAANDLAAKAGALAGSDPYGAVQLALRAYRTSHTTAAAEQVGWAYDRFAAVDRLLPDYTQAIPTVQAPVPTGTASPTGPSGTAAPVPTLDTGISQKVSADGRTVVGTDATGKVLVWQVSGRSVRVRRLDTVVSELDAAYRVALDRGGRYVAFAQQSGPPLALCEQEPGQYRTCDGYRHTPCTGKDELSFTHCIVVYDITAAKVRFYLRLDDVPMLSRGVDALAVDPRGQVLAATLVNGRSAQLLRWDLRSGRLRDRVALPSVAGVLTLWLAPGGDRAVMDEAVQAPSGEVTRSVSLVDIVGGRAVRHPLAEGMRDLNQVSVSLDGRRVAAMTRAGPDAYRITEWDAATGRVTARVDGLSGEQGRGSLALDATGSQAVVSWLPEPGRQDATDVRQLAAALGWRASVWRLPAAGPPTQLRLPPGWTVVLSGEDAPLVVVNGDALGLLLPGGEPPLRRLDRAGRAGPSHRDGVDGQVDRLCAVLADQRLSAAEQDLVPPGADTRAPC